MTDAGHRVGGFGGSTAAFLSSHDPGSRESRLGLPSKRKKNNASSSQLLASLVCWLPSDCYAAPHNNASPGELAGVWIP
jgi:hypothetical protein